MTSLSKAVWGCWVVGVIVGAQMAGVSAAQQPPPGRSSLDRARQMSAIIMPVADKKLKREDYKLTDAAHGVRFDIDGDGIEEQIGWPHQDSGLAFLALDRNGNGKIDNGKELFGSFTHPTKSNGFAALLVDAGLPGLISDRHPIFGKLLLWDDANHNGLSDPGELEKFSEHYVGISLAYGKGELKDEHGNVFRCDGNATIRVDESKRYPEPPVKCEGQRCRTDRSEELSRIIEIYDVSFVVG